MTLKQLLYGVLGLDQHRAEVPRISRYLIMTPLVTYLLRVQLLYWVFNYFLSALTFHMYSLDRILMLSALLRFLSLLSSRAYRYRNTLIINSDGS
jgi:hypothetical protein